MNENDILMWIIEEAKKSTQVLDAEQRKPANRRSHIAKALRLRRGEYVKQLDAEPIDNLNAS